MRYNQCVCLRSALKETHTRTHAQARTHAHIAGCCSHWCADVDADFRADVPVRARGTLAVLQGLDGTCGATVNERDTRRALRRCLRVLWGTMGPANGPSTFAAHHARMQRERTLGRSLHPFIGVHGDRFPRMPTHGAWGTREVLGVLTSAPRVLPRYSQSTKTR